MMLVTAPKPSYSFMPEFTMRIVISSSWETPTPTMHINTAATTEAEERYDRYVMVLMVLGSVQMTDIAKPTSVNHIVQVAWLVSTFIMREKLRICAPITKT